MSGVLCRSVARVKTRILLSDTINKTPTSGLRYFSVTQRRNMKLVQFTSAGAKPGCNADVRVGFLQENNVIDLNCADPTLPTTLLDILRKGAMDKVRQ